MPFQQGQALALVFLAAQEACADAFVLLPQLGKEARYEFVVTGPVTRADFTEPARRYFGTARTGQYDFIKAAVFFDEPFVFNMPGHIVNVAAQDGHVALRLKDEKFQFFYDARRLAQEILNERAAHATKEGARYFAGLQRFKPAAETAFDFCRQARLAYVFLRRRLGAGHDV